MPSAIVQQVLDRLRQDEVCRHASQSAPLAALAPYALSDEERDSLILPNFSWMVEGELAGCSRPRTDDALDALSRHGVQAVLSLSEQPLPAAALDAREMVAEHVPIADFTAPTLAQIAGAMAAVDRFRRGGRPTVEHCGAGLGRTGTILACVLVTRGMPAAQAIRQVRTLRPGSIETPEQEAAIERWAQQQEGQDRVGS